MIGDSKPFDRSELCILASDRSWNWPLIDILQERCGCKFILISDSDELTYEKISTLHPRFIFFPHWSSTVDKKIYESYECIIFHMTDLPFGRGGSPLQNLIMRGIYETKITALRCVEEIDAGPIYLKKPFTLFGSASEIFLRATKVIEEMIVEIVKKLPEPKSQIGDPILFKRRKPAEGNLDKAESLDQIFDLIRMLDADGYPRAFIDIGCFRMEFSRSLIKSNEVLADVRIFYKPVNE